jgi:hypothetical protein
VFAPEGFARAAPLYYSVISLIAPLFKVLYAALKNPFWQFLFSVKPF